MKRVLFISYHFPPCPSIGGSLRSKYFAKHLPQFGWTPTIVTCNFPGFHDRPIENSSESTAANTSGNDISRISSFWNTTKPYNLQPLGWMFPLHRAAQSLLSKKDFQLIYVSSPPFPPALSAAHLKKKFKLPFVLDCRDAWSLNPYAGWGSLGSRLVTKTVTPVVERWLFKQADKLIVTSPSTRTEYARKYPNQAEKIELITNGFDEDSIKSCTETSSNPSTEVTEFLFVGELDTGGRNGTLLLNAIRLLLDRGHNAKLKIVGPYNKELPGDIERLQLTDAVTLSGRLSHKQAIGEMSRASVLLLYNAPSKTAVVPIATKTFEYLRLGKPILGIAPDGENINLIKRYAKTQRTVTTYSEHDIAGAMEYFVNKAGDLTSAEVNEEFIKSYNRLELTRHLAIVFEKLVC